MNGIHDIGGMDGFGPVSREENEPVFHQAWERRVFGMLLALPLRNVDEFRHAIERMNPAHYLNSSYYEHWLAAAETLLHEKGLVTREELGAKVLEIARSRPRARKVAAPAAPQYPIAGAEDSSSAEKDRAQARFEVGAAVIAHNINPVGHTRLPRYVRGKRGVIEADHGVFTFPDTNAHNAGKNRQHVYNVRFDARELWGTRGSDSRMQPRDSLRIDLWQDYLEPVAI